MRNPDDSMTPDASAPPMKLLAPATPVEWLLLEPHIRALAEARQQLAEAQRLAIEAQQRFAVALDAVAPEGAVHFDPNQRLWYQRDELAEPKPALVKSAKGG